MATIIRIEHVSLGSYGFYDFSDQEIEGRIRVLPNGNHEIQKSQVGDMKVYRTEMDHYLFMVAFKVGVYDNPLKLWEIRELWDEFVLYPWFRHDQASHFTVVWRNPNVFEESWIQGMPEANVTMACEFQEPLGAVCYPPS